MKKINPEIRKIRALIVTEIVKKKGSTEIKNTVYRDVNKFEDLINKYGEDYVTKIFNPSNEVTYKISEAIKELSKDSTKIEDISNSFVINLCVKMIPLVTDVPYTEQELEEIYQNPDSTSLVVLEEVGAIYIEILNNIEKLFMSLMKKLPKEKQKLIIEHKLNTEK